MNRVHRWLCRDNRPVSHSKSWIQANTPSPSGSSFV